MPPCGKTWPKCAKSEPAYRIAGDGVHPDANGHFVIFRALAKTLDLPGDGVSASVDAAKSDSVSPGISGVKVGLNKLEFVWKPLLPTPRDPAWHGRFLETEGAGPTALILKVDGLPAGKHALYEENRLVGTASAGGMEERSRCRCVPAAIREQEGIRSMEAR